MSKRQVIAFAAVILLGGCVQGDLVVLKYAGERVAVSQPASQPEKTTADLVKENLP